MSEITKLNPQGVWKNFYSLTQIPRPSKHEAKVVAFVKEFGEKLGLETVVDEIGNVIIRKPATPGMENRKGVILQGHLDMVPQKNNEKVHDFTKDPIETIIDGEWVRANQTTLGADNGMGCAAAMAVLESKDLVHGPIEALFTIDEETGMTGANHLKAGMLNGDILMNLDSETEGELYVGCAGGVDVNVTMKYDECAAPAGYTAYRIDVKGLNGGHSGMDINIGRANANKLLVRFLNHCLYKTDMRLAEIKGGDMRNAIPREAYAIVLIANADCANFEAEVAKFDGYYKSEFAATEKGIALCAAKVAMPAKVVEKEIGEKIIKATFVCPHGVVRMSDSMPGLVETSNNLAIVECKDGNFGVKCLTRSSVESAKKGTMYKIGTVFDLIGANVEFSGSYPGWNPNMNSPILNTMKDCYKRLFNEEAKVMAIHAGLECGLLGYVYPNWDMISFGPTIEHPHSPVERVNVASVEKFWKFLVETLKNVPVKCNC